MKETQTTALIGACVGVALAAGLIAGMVALRPVQVAPEVMAPSPPTITTTGHWRAPEDRLPGRGVDTKWAPPGQRPSQHPSADRPTRPAMPRLPSAPPT